MNWATVSLGDCVTLASGGTPSKREPLNWGGDVPWATTKDLKTDRLWDTDDHVTPLGASSGTRYVDEQTILISVRGMALANRLPLAMAMRRMTFNQDLKAISCKPNSDPRFIFYWLKANESTLLALADEAAHGTKRIQTDRLLSLEVALPPIEIQRQIADTLSAYDDLIENNTRRIAILEEMAQRLYREWFVHFRYPGHESVPLVNSDLGPIPEGWEWKELGELASETRRSVRPEDVDSNTPYVGLEHLPRRSITLRDGGRADEVASSKLRFDEGNILFGKIRPYFHKVVVAPFDGISSTDIIVIEPKAQEHFGLVLSCVSSDDFVAHAAQTSQGTKMPRAAWKTLRRYPMPVAPHCTNHLFNKLLDEIVGELKVLARKSEVCRRLRDLLIPKLIASIPSPNQKLETNAT